MDSATRRTASRSRVRLVVSVLLATALACSATMMHSARATTDPPPPGVAVRDKADFVFFSYDVFTNPDTRAAYLDYIKRFRICLTNGYTNFSGQDLADVKASGCKLFVYRWFNGYYADELLGLG